MPILRLLPLSLVPLLACGAGCPAAGGEGEGEGEDGEGEGEEGEGEGEGEGDVCDERVDPASGSGSVVHDAGDDDLGFDVVDGVVEFHDGGVVSSEGNANVAVDANRGAVVDGDGVDVCGQLSVLHFNVSFAESPTVDTAIPFVFAGDPTSTNSSGENPFLFFVDVNETLSTADPLAVAYLGTGGEFHFELVNEDRVNSFGQRVAFTVSFSPVVDGVIDDSVVTTVSGVFAFSTFFRL